LELFYSFVKRLVEGFNNVKIDYAFTGALAASYYGVPRTTTDVDVLVHVSEFANAKAGVVAALKNASVVVDEHLIDEALSSGYNIATFADEASPFTVDIIFTLENFKKRPGTIAGLETFFQPPEGLILAKLRMIKATLPPERATKDEDDIKAILTFSKVNIETIKEISGKEGTLDIFERLIEP
jgi:hypothetical protein